MEEIRNLFNHTHTCTENEREQSHGGRGRPGVCIPPALAHPRMPDDTIQVQDVQASPATV